MLRILTQQAVFASGYTLSCQTYRTPVARDTSFCCGPNMPVSHNHKAGSDTLATSVQSNTVPPHLTGNVIQFSKIPRCHIHYTPEASPAASTAAASNNIQSREPSSRDLHTGSDAMRFNNSVNPFGTLSQTLLNVQ